MENTINFPTNSRNYRDEGYSVSEAHNLSRVELRRFKQLQRDSAAYLTRNDKGVPPIVSLSPEGEFAVPSPLDYPRNWTPDRIAAHRESSARLVARLNADHELGRWVAFQFAAAASGCGDRWQFEPDYNSTGFAYRAKPRAIAALKALGLDWID